MSFVGRYLDAQTVAELNNLQLSARRVVEGSALGLHRSHLKGASVEFRQSRAYVPGDDPRRLDWRVLARTDKPFVKEYDEETNLRCLIALDASGSMAYGGARGAGGPTKFDFAARLAAAVSYLLLAATESAGMAIVGPAVRDWLAPASASTQIARVVHLLDRAGPAGTTDPAAAAAAVCERLRRRGVVLWISDFFQPVTVIRDALARLRHARHEVTCLRVLHPDELTFPFSGWSRFTGLEAEPPRAAEAAAVRRQYLHRFRQHAAELTTACRAVSAEIQTFTTEMPVVDAVRQFLYRRPAG
jgi:uncharacterized protein (DUF58 family)